MIKVLPKEESVTMQAKGKRNSLLPLTKKHSAWTWFMGSRESQHYQVYCKFRNQVRNLTRKVRMQQEKFIAAEAKTNPQKFWNFARS